MTTFPWVNLMCAPWSVRCGGCPPLRWAHWHELSTEQVGDAPRGAGMPAGGPRAGLRLHKAL
eukprot:7906296-Pyramimonas_sp.AAC.2